MASKSRGAGGAPASAVGEACGKVLLVGEHAVVHGAPAIALGLGSGARVEVSRSDESVLELGAERYPLGSGAGDAAPVAARAFAALLEALGASSVAARATLDIPAGAGLGASAALGVALARACAALSGSGEPGDIARAALAWENVFHGDASGVDTAAAEHGGCIWFTRQEGATKLDVGGVLRVVVAQVEPGASTRRMVEAVAAQQRAEPALFAEHIADITALAHEARGVITAGDWPKLGQLMNANHVHLQALGVSTPGLDGARAAALLAGAFGAKLTGAGGGGCVIAVVDEGSEASVLEVWRGRGFPCFTATATPTPR